MLESTIHLTLSFHCLWYVNILLKMNKYLYFYDMSSMHDYKFLENRQYVVFVSPIMLCMPSRSGMNIVYGWSKSSNDRKWIRNKFANFIYFTMHSNFLMGGGVHVKFFFSFLTIFCCCCCGPFKKSFLNLLQYCCLFMLWFFGQEACEVLAPWAGIELESPALKGEVLTTGLPGKSLMSN